MSLKIFELGLKVLYVIFRCQYVAYLFNLYIYINNSSPSSFFTQKCPTEPKYLSAYLDFLIHLNGKHIIFCINYILYKLKYKRVVGVHLMIFSGKGP